MSWCESDAFNDNEGSANFTRKNYFSYSHIFCFISKGEKKKSELITLAEEVEMECISSD